MLNTQMLCARVMAPARARSRVLQITSASKQRAQMLKDSGKVDKTVTRILSDATVGGLESLRMNLRLHREIVREWAAEVEGQPISKVQFSLSEDVWQQIQEQADRTGLSESAFVRAVCHVAMEQIFDELSGR